MRMKKFLGLIGLLPVLVLAQPSPSKGFTINGKIPGYPDGTEVKMIRNGDNAEIATTKFTKSSFVLKGNVQEPVLCFLIIGTEGAPIQLYAENRMITVTKDLKLPGRFIVSGSSSHRDFNEFANTFTPLAQQLSSLATSINSMIPGPDRDGLMTIYNSTMNQIQHQIDTFMARKPLSLILPFVLNVTAQFYEDDPLLLEQRFNRLDSSIKKMEAAKQLEQIIAVKKIGAIGTQALDFVQPDTSGNSVSLSSFRGKYVLVDFWASWCGPCRNENPNVVENFNKFRNKNFTVLGVSLDKPGQKDKWIQAIKQDSLDWNHVSDLQFWNNAAAQIYHILAIPQNILVDPGGKIVGRNLRGPALQAKLCEIFGCN